MFVLTGPPKSPCLKCQFLKEDKDQQRCADCQDRVVYYLWTMGLEPGDHTFIIKEPVYSRGEYRGRGGGRTTDNVCKFPGCNNPSWTGGYCTSCSIFVSKRKHRWPNNPEYWEIRSAKRGERLDEIYQQEYQNSTLSMEA